MIQKEGVTRTKYGYVVDEKCFDSGRYGWDKADFLSLSDVLYTKYPTLKELLEWVRPGLTYDYAVPQSWFDEYMNQHNGERPNAVWAYPKDSIFGSPLFINDLLEEWKVMVLAEVERINKEEIA